MEYRYTGIWRDTELLKEIDRSLAVRGVGPGKLIEHTQLENAGADYAPAPGTIEEAIVLGVGRPALLVQDGSFTAAPGDVWNQRLKAVKPELEAILPSVGRVQHGQGARAKMIGTGWLIAPDVIVTNRHVAHAMAAAGGSNRDWQFTPTSDPAAIDFKVEHERPAVDAAALAKILHVEPEGSFDVALMRLGRSIDRRPIELARRIFGPEHVAAIGYPAWDGQRNPGPEMMRIFGNAFQVKRLAPGTLLSVADHQLEHDCSTLGGNSGSVVWGLNTRRALGLHFAGRFHEANYAVPAPVIEDIASREGVL